MGNCHRKIIQLNPGAVLDRVISQASNDDDCLLYKLANYKKGGELIEAHTIGQMIEVEKLIKEQFGILMYCNGDGQLISRSEYFRWRFRNVKHVAIPVEATTPTDPLGKWEDHEACWQMQYRGSLGETLLHLLIICDTRIHTRLARALIKAYPKLALDVFEGEEYLGASALHLAIAYGNNEIIHLLVEAGARVDQRAIGSFFLPKDQQRIPPAKQTDYEGLAYFGEYPLAWAAAVGNESVYNLLLDKGAHPDWQDSFGNMTLHVVVVADQLGMYGYALRHPKVVASNAVMNFQGLTPLTLACRLGRASVFREMLELSSREFWRYSNHTCSAYPLNALDTISPDGKTNWNSALFMILEGSKEEHLDMLDGGIIQRLLEEKWKTFAQREFLKRITIAFLHLLTMSFAVYLRPADRSKSLNSYVDVKDYMRLGFELCTILSCLCYLIFQQGEEIKNQGIVSFIKQFPQSPPKALFLLANFGILASIPFRIVGDILTEEVLLCFSMVGSWFFMMFFAGAIRLTGPFITMILSMVTGDMLTFGIIYIIFLLAFSQAFFYLYKSHPSVNDLLFESYPRTWMAMYQITLGSYSYNDLALTAYPTIAKGVFIMFMIMVPILLLNMLIAMMGNTYSQVVERSEKEWVKQWAKLVVSLERGISQELARQYIQEYSIKLPGGSSDGTELRGVMVIKTKNKTRANQRKGAVSNWKRVGRVTIHALKKKGLTGEEMRIIMWGHGNSVCTPQGTTPRQLSVENLSDSTFGYNREIGDRLLADAVSSLRSQVDELLGFGIPSHYGMKPFIPEIATPTTQGPALSFVLGGDYCASSLPFHLPKVKRRNITYGLQPKIVIFSDPNDNIRVNFGSEESDIDLRCNSSRDLTPSPQLSPAAEASTVNPSHEPLTDSENHADTNGRDNPAFEASEEVSFSNNPSPSILGLTEELESSCSNEAAAVPVPTVSASSEEEKIKRTHSRQASRKVKPKCGGKNRSSEEKLTLSSIDEGRSGCDSSEQPQVQQRPKTKSKKKRPRTGKHASSPTSATTDRKSKRRPHSAFTPAPVSCMNDLIAWDHPDDQI